MIVARIGDVRSASPRSWLVQLELPRPTLSFAAGQSVLVGPQGRHARRPYSVACSPAETARLGRIELLVGAEAETQAGWLLRPGTPVHVEGPVGSFRVLDLHAYRRVLFLAGGTGIAPIRSMLRTLCQRSQPIDLALLYSARCAAELVFLHEWRELSASGRLTLHPTVTRTDPTWTGARGRLTSRDIGGLIVDPLETLCVICGPFAFVLGTAAILADLGVPDDAVRTERWMTTAAEPR